MKLKGKPKRKPVTEIEDIVYRRNGRWYYALTDHYISNAYAKRLLSYYRKRPLTTPGYYARGEKKKARRLAQKKMQKEGKDKTDVELRSPRGKTKVKYSKRKKDQQTISESEIDTTTDYGRLIDYVVPVLEDNLRTYEQIDINEVDNVYDLQMKLERYVDVDTTMKGGMGKFAKGWTPRRTNAIADHLGITLMEVRKRYYGNRRKYV